MLLAVYGAGFSWRQLLVGAVAGTILYFAMQAFRDAFPKREFSRIQFKIDLTWIGQALLDANICGEEDLAESAGAVFESLPGGRITFTWLGPGLYYMNVVNVFTARPELLIRLKAYGDRAKALEHSLTDSIEFRITMEAIELVLRSPLSSG